jgi:hypothetical protein
MLMSVKLGQVLLLDSSVTKALIVLHLFLSIHCSLMHMKCGVKASTLIFSLLQCDYSHIYWLQLVDLEASNQLS